MTDILAALAWLAGPGLAVVSAFILEQLRPFDELSPNGKLVVAVTVAGILGVSATALANTLAADSALLIQLQPYANVIVPAVALLAQQLAHGRNEAKRADYNIADTDFQP